MALFRIFAIALISWECLPTCAIISSIELTPPPTVEIGETATYTCNATSTTGADPLLAWRITAADGDLIKTLPGAQENDPAPSDGVASSSVTINVTSNLIGGKIYCVATEAGGTSEGTQLFSTIRESTNSAALGEACSDIVVCTTAFSSCPSEVAAPSGQTVCRCTDLYYDTNGQTAGGLCNAKSPLEAACDTSVTDSCLTENAECRTVTETCACRAGFLQSGTSCVSDSAGLGEACVNPEKTCVVTSSECSTTTGLCACSSGYYRLDSNSCNPKSVVGQECNPSAVDSCRTSDSYCDKSTLTCVCESDRTYDDTTDTCFIETTTAITTEAATPIEHSGTSTATTSTTITTDIATIPTTQATNDTTSITVITTQHPATQVINNTTELTTDTTRPTTQDTNDTTETTTDTTPTTTQVTKHTTEITTDSTNPTPQVTKHTTETTTDTTPTTTHVTKHPTEITSVTATYSPTVVKKGQAVTFTCTVTPVGVADSYRWLWDGTLFRITETFQLSSVQSDNDGSYMCEASDSYGKMRSSPITLDVRYTPEYILATGGDTVDYFGNLDADPIIVKCTMSANPEIHTYYFYNSSEVILQASRSNTYTIDDTGGYGTYSCEAENEVGRSTRRQYFNVQLQTSTEKTGAATEDRTDTVTIVAIVLGVVTAVMVVVVVIVLCCNYGRCRKDNMEVTPAFDDTPDVKPRFPTCSPPLAHTKLGTTTSTFYLTCTTHGEPTTNFSATIENEQHEPRPLVVRPLKDRPRRLRSFGSPSDYYSSKAPNNPSKKRKRMRRRQVPEADSGHYDDMRTETFRYGSVTPPDDYLSSIA